MRRHTILIAHRDERFADALAAELRVGGDYQIIECPGPLPPQRCVRCDKGYCPLTEGADLMIYDPRLTAQNAEGASHYLAVDSALAHPEVPMLLAWSPESSPDAGTLRAIRAEAPHIRIAANRPEAFLEQVRALLKEADAAEVAH